MPSERSALRFRSLLGCQSSELINKLLPHSSMLRVVNSATDLDLYTAAMITRRWCSPLHPAWRQSLFKSKIFWSMSRTECDYNSCMGCYLPVKTLLSITSRYSIWMVCLKTWRNCVSTDVREKSMYEGSNILEWRNYWATWKSAILSVSFFFKALQNHG